MKQGQGYGQGSGGIDVELDACLDAQKSSLEARNDQDDWRFLAIVAYLGAAGYLVMLLFLLFLGVEPAILLKFTLSPLVLLALGLYCRLAARRSHHHRTTKTHEPDLPS